MHGLSLLSRFVGAVLIAVGTGLIAYGAAVDPQKYHAPAGIDILYGPAESIGWGVGLFVGGVLCLLIFGVRLPQFDKPGRP
jgi:hypothetical protein